MTDSQRRDPSAQDTTPHGGDASIIPHPDGCRTITLHHISEAALRHVLRAAHRGGVSLPPSLTAEMYRQGIIRRSGNRQSTRPDREREALAYRACALTRKGAGRTWNQAAAKLELDEDGNTLWRWHEKYRGQCPHCAMG